MTGESCGLTICAGEVRFNLSGFRTPDARKRASAPAWRRELTLGADLGWCGVPRSDRSRNGRCHGQPRMIRAHGRAEGLQ